MSDDFDKLGDDFDALPAEGGAMGGGGSDVAPQGRLKTQKVEPIKPISLDEAKKVGERAIAEDQYQQTLGKVAMSRGGYLDELRARDPAAAAKFEERRNTGNAATFLSGASGVPFVGPFLDEIFGVTKSGKLSGPEYDKARQEAIDTIKAANNYSPMAKTAGSLLMPMPASALGRIATTGLAGAAEGAGGAPTMAEVPKATAVGGGIGLGAGLLGEGLRALGGAAGAKKAGVEEGVRQKAEGAAQDAYNSARGVLGAKTADANRALEVLAERAGSDSGDAALRDAITARMGGQDVQALKDQIARNYLERLDELFPGIEAAKAARAEAAKGLAPDAIQAATQSRLNDSSGLLRRAMEMGPKVVLPVVGGALAGPLGAGAGALGGAALGRSGTTLRNALTDPYVSTRLLGGLEAGLSGAGAAVERASPLVERNALEPWSRFLGEEEQP